MGWNQSIFTLLIVTSSGGTPTGLFIYNGGPAKGNLVAQIVAPGVTSDPFGNAVAAIANLGHWSAGGVLLRHFGIDQNGNTYLANASGLTVVFENSSDGSIQFYNTSGAGLGNLVETIAPASGTDPSGNAYVQGFASYAGGIAAQLSAAVLRFINQASPPFAAPEVFSATAGAAGTAINVIGGKGTSGATGVTATWYDSLASPQAVEQIVIGPVVNAVAPSTTALLEVQGVIQTTSLNAIHASGNLQSDLGDIVGQSGNLLINTIGKGLRVKEGSGAKQGTALLVGGTVTVNNTNVTAASRIFLTAQDNLSTGALRVSARTAGTSFTITSSVAGDSGSVAWEIFEPA